ncbi:unnamed protein product [Fraxinus pennsylvanica]|uniref:Uncharacterized protein n=1 Tax=Fraxinus pennsylvanica TaxID=56036 RepID=A0AAD2ABA9_9LAMI|nr:unnamed protein product [Fraxinus pennsylvanica]
MVVQLVCCHSQILGEESFSFPRSTIEAFGLIPSSTDIVTGSLSPVLGSTIFFNKNINQQKRKDNSKMQSQQPPFYQPDLAPALRHQNDWQHFLRVWRYTCGQSERDDIHYDIGKM